MAQVLDAEMLTAAMRQDLPSAPGLTDDIDGQPPHHPRRTPRSGAATTASQEPGSAPIGGYFSAGRELGQIPNVSWTWLSLAYETPSILRASADGCRSSRSRTQLGASRATVATGGYHHM